MKTYDSLKEEFDRKVDRLRKKCSHPKITNWVEDILSQDVPAGHAVRFCVVCKDIVNRRGYCCKCNRLIEEKNGKWFDTKWKNEATGNGGTIKALMCLRCLKLWKRAIK